MCVGLTWVAMMYWTPPGLGSTANAAFSSSERRTGTTCSPFRNLGKEGRGVSMMYVKGPRREAPQTRWAGDGEGEEGRGLLRGRFLSGVMSTA